METLSIFEIHTCYSRVGKSQALPGRKKRNKDQIVRMGVPDKFIEHGTVAELHQICGFDAEGIAKKVLEMI